ncbi:MAG: hypothetical protein ACJAW3_000210 [Lentimonas sp.]|jgi:hypothetical protein
MRFLKFVILPLLLLNSSNLFAQTIDSIHYGWVVYEINENTEDKKCYIATTAHKKNSSYTGSRNPYLAITRYSKNKIEEISLYSGYEYKINQNVHLLIGDQSHILFTKDDTAWAKNRNEDKKIIQSMLASKLVKARSDSSVGNYAIDQYSLKGFSRAYSRMRKLCK